MIVTFFEDNSDTYTEKEYSGECAPLMMLLDMDEHIKKGGWCMAGNKNRYKLITTIGQLWGRWF